MSYMKRRDPSFAYKSLARSSSEYGNGDIVANLKCERFPDDPRLLDSSVDITISDFCISWDSAEKMMDELNEVIKRYLI